MKAMRQVGTMSERPDKAILFRYLNGLKRSGGWQVLVLHYAVILLLLVVFRSSALSGPYPHPEILIKLLGSFCFLVGTIAIPLAAHELFPSPGESDPAFDTTPQGPATLFYARMKATAVMSMLAMLPLIPLFIIFDPIMGRSIDPFDIIPFLIGVVTSVWIFFLMELVSTVSDPGGRLARRLGVIAAFILMHLGFVGLMGRLARVTLQRTNILKLVIDINPFSQLYILMEGPGQKWLLIKTDMLELTDYRLYLLVVQLIVLMGALAVHKALQKPVDD